MEATLQVDRYTMPAFYEQKTVNFRTEPVEVSVSELSIRRSGVYFRGSGLAVDTDGQTSIGGLFAAGDCATVSGGIAGAAVLGHVAGEGVAAFLSSRNGARPEIDMAAADALREYAISHLAVDKEREMSWKHFEDETRRTVSDYVGVRRNAKGLNLALDTLRALATREPDLKADDLHGLMRVHESTSIRLNAELMAESALKRKETRTGSAHRRLDYPDTLDPDWKRFVLVERGNDGPSVSTMSCEQPLSAAFTRLSSNEMVDAS